MDPQRTTLEEMLLLQQRMEDLAREVRELNRRLQAYLDDVAHLKAKIVTRTKASQAALAHVNKLLNRGTLLGPLDLNDTD